METIKNILISIGIMTVYQIVTFVNFLLLKKIFNPELGLNQFETHILFIGLLILFFVISFVGVFSIYNLIKR